MHGQATTITWILIILKKFHENQLQGDVVCLCSITKGGSV